MPSKLKMILTVTVAAAALTGGSLALTGPALAKGKQLWDKRETERRRTADKEAREAISRSRKA